MPSKKQRPTKSKAPFVLTILVCAGAVAALAQYVRSGHSIVPAFERAQITSDEQDVIRPVREKPAPRVEDQDEPAASGPYVFAPVSSEGTSLSFAKSPVHPPAGVDAKVYVINRFLQATRVADPSAKLLSVDVKDGVASLYFNGAMNKTVGTDDEQTLLEGLLKNLQQFPDVKSALFFADGKQIETFGNVDLTEAQPVNSYDEPAPTKRSRTREPSQLD